MTVLSQEVAAGRQDKSGAMMLLLGVASVIFFIAVPVCVEAQEKLPLLKGPELDFPSIWRVLLGFALVVGIAFCMVALLRRGRGWLPLKAAAPSPGIVVTSHQKLSRSVDAHIIEVGSERFMVVSSAQQIAVTSLITRVQHDDTAPIS